MGFKWFKARITMNRMPTHSSAVAGSYKTTSFDSRNEEYLSNDNQRNKGILKPEPQLSIRPLSMPSLNNPMAGMANGDDLTEFVRSSNNDITRHSSITTLEGSEFDEENMYGGFGVGNPVSLPKHKLNDFDENNGVRRPTPAPKMLRANKHKARAPMPNTNLSTISASTSEYGTVDFVTLPKNRKTSQDSDLEV